MLFRSLEKKEGYKADIIVLLYPTSPFLKKEKVQEAINLLKTEKFNSVISVVEDKGRYWAYDENKGNYNILYPKQRTNRQYYKSLYKENGAIYFSNYETIMKNNILVDNENVGFIIMEPDEVIDIDTPHDWIKAEKKISDRNK